MQPYVDGGSRLMVADHLRASALGFHGTPSHSLIPAASFLNFSNGFSSTKTIFESQTTPKGKTALSPTLSVSIHIYSAMMVHIDRPCIGESCRTCDILNLEVLLVRYSANVEYMIQLSHDPVHHFDALLKALAQVE